MADLDEPQLPPVTDVPVTHSIGASTGVSATPIHDLSFPADWKAGEPRLEPEQERPPTDPALRRAWERARSTPSTSDAATTEEPETVPLLPIHRLGQTVWFRSRTGAWTVPAIITATVDSLHRGNVEAGHIPDLSSPDHVHLTVLTPGKPGHVSDETWDTHPELADPARINRPAGGSFNEWDVAYWEPTPEEAFDAAIVLDVELASSPYPAGFDFSVQPAGTWMWPL